MLGWEWNGEVLGWEVWGWEVGLGSVGLGIVGWEVWLGSVGLGIVGLGSVAGKWVFVVTVSAGSAKTCHKLQNVNLNFSYFYILKVIFKNTYNFHIAV